MEASACWASFNWWLLRRFYIHSRVRTEMMSRRVRTVMWALPHAYIHPSCIYQGKLPKHHHCTCCSWTWLLEVMIDERTPIEWGTVEWMNMTVQEVRTNVLHQYLPLSSAVFYLAVLVLFLRVTDRVTGSWGRRDNAPPIADTTSDKQVSEWVRWLVNELENQWPLHPSWSWSWSWSSSSSSSSIIIIIIIICIDTCCSIPVPGIPVDEGHWTSHTCCLNWQLIVVYT